MTPRLQHVYSPSAPKLRKDLSRTAPEVFVWIAGENFQATDHLVHPAAR